MKETIEQLAQVTSEEVYDHPQFQVEDLDIAWIRENGELIEVRDMNEYHAKAALRKLITAIAEDDIDTIRTHILGMEVE